MYGKQTETAIAALSRLAEVWDGGKTRLSASDIARERGLQGPFVAKMLTVLSQAGLVDGTPGPGGGYALARHPSKIHLYDVFTLFEREETSNLCPFGGGVCGKGEPCAIHHKLVDVQTSMSQLLRHTTFEAFREAYQDRGLRPVQPGGKPRRKRESYRAPKQGKGA
ncbi:MAG TPA: Rrf2 family transcriptional regulator [Phycisphaerales bacterium]|nr:Rrf2 family transcriptional regulator [Phycisphaerales bacterium]